MFDTLWINIHVATMAEGYEAPNKEGFGIINNAALGVKDGKIAFIGALEHLPGVPETLAKNIEDGHGKWVTPALIDCHTHLAYAGNRAAEFEKRLMGASYEEISKAGGGILSTVTAVRDAEEDDIYNDTLARMKNLLREGVATFEIKSGYGLDLESERKLLRVATRLGEDLGIKIQRTFLGAHALPEEYKGKADEYIRHLCDFMLPALSAEGLVDAVDAFCENIAFSTAQITELFAKAHELSLNVKLHAEQLTNQGGALLAAKHNALSADHLEYVDEKGVKAMAKAGVVAVLLPGAFYFLREKTAPPIEFFRKHKVPMAIATDHNPGTSPGLSLLLMLNMACTLFRMTPEEALAGVTRHAAAALGLQDSCGTLAPGKMADLAFWDIAHPRDLSYQFGVNPCIGLVLAGKPVVF